MAEFSNKQIKDKVLKYEAFINDVLKEDLSNYNQLLGRMNSEISEWILLKSVLDVVLQNDMANGFKTKMDLGTNIYVQADVIDASRVIINIGCNVYVPFEIEEALRFIEKQIKLLEYQVTIIKKKTCEIKGRIKLVVHGIQELSGLQ